MSDLLSKYKETVENPPKAGDILKTYDDSPVILHVQIEEGKPPFVYGRAFVSEVLDDTLGWYVRGENDDHSIGWKCVLMTRARRDVIKKCAVVDDKVRVKSLRVVRPSESGRALLCEVEEYCDEKTAVQHSDG